MTGKSVFSRARGQLRRGPQRTVSLMAAVTAMSIVTTSPVFFAGAFGAQIAEDLRIGPAALGGMATTFFAVTGLTATHLGRLADRLGGRRAGSWAVLASASSLLVAGLGSHYWSLIVAMIFGGIGNGLGGPTANMVVADRMEASVMGIAYGIKQSAVPAATLLGGIAVPLFVVGWGWRPTIVGAAILAFLSLAIIPHSAGRGRPATAKPGQRKPGLDALTIATGAAFMFGIAAATSMSTLLSAFAVGEGFSPTFAGLTLSAGSAGAIVVRIVAGRLADKDLLDGAAVSAGMMVVGAIGFLGITTGTSVGIAGGAFVAYAIGWGWSGLMILNLMRAHTAAPGSATGVVLTGAAVGGMVGPLCVGLIAEAAGFPLGWMAAGVLSLAAAASAWKCRSLVASRSALAK